jgi:tetratricopeptide (TPR) repeat protein
MSNLGDVGHNVAMAGQVQVISVLQQQERNLMHAFDLARANHWWGQVLGTMQGLKVLYDHTDQRVAWARLVDLVTPDLVDPVTDLPRPGLEEHWSYLTSYRAQLARRARAWATAGRLQQALVSWARDQAAEALAAGSATLTSGQRHDLRNLSVTLNELGNVRQEQRQPECVPAFKEALDLRKRIGDRAGQASITYALGEAYRLLSPLRDLDEAERWYKHSLELRDAADRIGHGRCLTALGGVYRERWDEAREGGQTVSEAWHHLRDARDAQLKALALTPPEAVNDRAVVHNELGITYANAGAGWLETAMSHNRDAIRSFVEIGNRYGASQTRFNAAAMLNQYGQTDEALMWAQAALADFHAYGRGAAPEIAATEQLIADIQHIASRG